MTETWHSVARAWRTDPDARLAHARELAAAPYEAFAWETVPVSRATRDREYEQVVVDSPSLATVRADPEPFREHFEGDADVVRFDNLGGDAVLVVPGVPADGTAYPHLAAFLRSAPEAAIHRLWQEVGRAVEEHWETSDAPVWVSTAGLGVHWLHVRLDARPKYYRHDPFRSF